MSTRELEGADQLVTPSAPLPPPAPNRAPPAKPTPARADFRHIRALDGLRGTAVLAVVLFHFAPGLAPGGFLGVDLFFVLSGFLITSLLVNEWSGAHRIALGSFWMRRGRRLLPALFLLLAVVGIYELVFASQVEANHVAGDGLWSAVYLANWHFIASGQSYIQQFVVTAPSPLRHMWSLAIEEQFYLVWPLLVAGVGWVAARSAVPRRQARRFRQLLVGLCVVLGIASFVRMITVFAPGADPSRVYYGTDTRAFVVLVGALLGARTAGAPTVANRYARNALIVVGVVCGVVVLAMMTSLTTASAWLYEGGYGLVAVLLLAILAAAAQPGRNPLAALFSWRPLVGLGLISYGVYLWHWPIGLWVNADNSPFDGPVLFIVRCVLTLAAALASYYLVEMPIRRGALSRLGGARKLVPVLCVVTLLLVFGLPSLSFPSVGAPPKQVTPGAHVNDVTATYANAPRCDGRATPVPVSTGSPVRVQLEGNSIAGEVRDCLRRILHQRNATLEGVNPPGFLLCNAIPAITRQVRNPATRPQAAVLFVFTAYDPRCGTPWHRPVDDLVAMWKKAGVHVYLVPSVPFVPGTEQADQLATGPVLEAEYYSQLAAADPQHITLLDAGKFLRDANGAYVWRMPCVAGGEPGCDAQDTVGVRWTDGFHYCTDPDFAAHGCKGAANQAGERRAAAAIASGLLPGLASQLSGEATRAK